MIYKTSYDSPLSSLSLLAARKGSDGVVVYSWQKHFLLSGRTGFEADAADPLKPRGWELAVSI